LFNFNVSYFFSHFRKFGYKFAFRQQQLAGISVGPAGVSDLYFSRPHRRPSEKCPESKSEPLADHFLLESLA